MRVVIIVKISFKLGRLQMDLEQILELVLLIIIGVAMIPCLVDQISRWFGPPRQLVEVD